MAMSDPKSLGMFGDGGRFFQKMQLSRSTILEHRCQFMARQRPRLSSLYKIVDTPSGNKQIAGKLSHDTVW